MSIRTVPTLICDGCGTVITMGRGICLAVCPTDQTVVQEDESQSPERHFCSEGCIAWWHGQFPRSGPWGPAWDERDWWCECVGPCAESMKVTTVPAETPLMNLEGRIEDPTPL